MLDALIRLFAWLIGNSMHPSRDESDHDYYD